MSWGSYGRDIAAKLMEAKTFEAIEAIAKDAIEMIRGEGENKSRKIAFKMVSREVLKTFPRSEEEKPFYWYDPSGKKDLPHWRHCFFQHFSLTSEEWGTDPSKREAAIQTTTADELFDSETETYLQQAIESTGLDREEVLKRAIASYAKVVSRNRRDDIETIPTEKLLNDPSLRTLPGRGEELAKRAIRAILKHNNEIATGDGDRWAITQSIIAALTGVRPSTVKMIIEEFRGAIDDHNEKFGIDGYSNRRIKMDIREAIDLAKLQPDGME